MKAKVGMKVKALNSKTTWLLEEQVYNGEVVEVGPEKIEVKFSDGEYSEKIKVKFSGMEIKKFGLTSKDGKEVREVKETKKYKICETVTFVPVGVAIDNERIYFEEKSEGKNCVYKDRVMMIKGESNNGK